MYPKSVYRCPDGPKISVGVGGCKLVSLFRPNSLGFFPMLKQNFKEVHYLFNEGNLAVANPMVCMLQWYAVV